MGIRGFFHHWFSCRHSRGEWFVRRVTRKLRLSGSQRSELSALLDTMINLRREMRGMRWDCQDEVSALLTDATLDREKATEFLQAPVKAVNDRSRTIVEALGNFYDSLDSGQQARIRRYFEQRRCFHSC